MSTSMSSEQRPQTPALTVHGAWHGEVGDPERIFKGQIAESSISGLKAGTKITVSYDAPLQRTPNLNTHGTYTLHVGTPHAGSQDVKLMSFTNLTEKTGGQDDTEQEYWQATPIPQ